MQVKNAIIFVHGRERNANEYFKTMVSAIESLGQTENVAVIAPKFKNRKMYLKILIFIGPILGGDMEIIPSQALIQQGTVLLLSLIRWSLSLQTEPTFQK